MSNSIPEPTAHLLPGHTHDVLLVEDDKTNARIAEMILTRGGARVQWVENGRDAVEAASLMRFDVILMDISLPLMDGVTATRYIRDQAGPNRNTPILAVTTHGLPGDRERFLSAGMNGYLRKPISTAALLAAIESVMPNTMSIPVIEAAPQSDTPPDIPLLDEATAYHLREDVSREMFPAMAAAFIENARGRLARLEAALNRGDMDTVRFEAHTLSSSAGAYGLSRMHMLAGDIDMALRNDVSTEVADTARALLNCGDASFAALKDMIAASDKAASCS